MLQNIGKKKWKELTHTVNMKDNCVICKEEILDEWGHNPAPVKEEGRCCDTCNFTVVIPARIKLTLNN